MFKNMPFVNCVFYFGIPHLFLFLEVLKAVGCLKQEKQKTLINLIISSAFLHV